MAAHRSPARVLETTTTEELQLEDSLERAASGVGPAERRVEALRTLVLVVGSAALWLVADPVGDWHPLAAALCVVGIALGTRVRFDTGLGYFPASPLLYAPLAFSVPAQALPLASAAGCLLVLAASPRGTGSRARTLWLLGGNQLHMLWAACALVALGRPADELPLIFLPVVLIAQMGADLVAAIVRQAALRELDLREELRTSRLWVVDAALIVAGLPVALALADHPWAPLAMLPLFGLLALVWRERRLHLERVLELNRAYRGVAVVLGDVVEADDSYTGHHSRDVVDLAIDVGRRLGLDRAALRDLEFGALLHDLGKVTVPKEILNRPGPLTAEEFEVVKGHAAAGQAMLDRVGGFMRQVGRIVRHHHERWDGRGYPDGLIADEIPLEARIITACDSWNAMRTDRVYRSRLSFDVAVAEMRDNAGLQFDPAVVVALLAAVGPAAKAAEPAPGDALPAAA